MTQRNKEWGSFVTRARQAAGITRIQLAKSSGIDPSYITLIEKHGYVPKADKLESILGSLELSKEQFDMALLSLDRAPIFVPRQQLEAMVRAYYKSVSN